MQDRITVYLRIISTLFIRLFFKTRYVSKAILAQVVDAMFPSNKAEVIVVNTPSEGVSQNNVYKIAICNNERNELLSDAKMQIGNSKLKRVKLFL